MEFNFNFTSTVEYIYNLIPHNMVQKDIIINYNGIDHPVRITITYADTDTIIKAEIGDSELEFTEYEDGEGDIMMLGEPLDAKLVDLIEAAVMKALEEE